MSAVQATAILVDAQNVLNRCKIADLPVSKNKQFLSRKIHKLKKILKLSCNLFRSNNTSAPLDQSFEEWRNHQNSIEEQMQNYENELLEKKLSAKQCNTINSSGSFSSSLEHDQNVANENWENWDSCCLCANPQSQLPWTLPPPPPYTETPSRTQVPSSICYVFMPGQVEPVPVKLRNAKIPGGAMWIVYRPDFDICCRDNLYEITSNQMAQAQRPVLV